MAEPGEADFDIFLVAGEAYRREQEVWLRGRSFLEDRGVEFVPDGGFAVEWFEDYSESLGYLYRLVADKENEVGRGLTEQEVWGTVNSLRDAIITAAAGVYEKRCAQIENDNDLKMLSYVITRYGPTGVDGCEPPADGVASLKKIIQAQYRARGMPSAWSELADAELPGKPLTDGDEALVDEARQYIKNMDIPGRLRRTEDVIQTTLQEAGHERITDQDQAVITHLACAYLLSADHSRGWQEEARLELIRRNVPLSPVWQAVIAHLADCEE